MGRIISRASLRRRPSLLSGESSGQQGPVIRSCPPGHRHARRRCTGTSAPRRWSSRRSARGEGMLAKDGPLVVATGKHTGRSAKDKFIVRDAETENTIWWDNNTSMTPDAFRRAQGRFPRRAGGKGDPVRPGPLRRLAARASRPRPRDQRARLAQPVHPHPAGPPRRRRNWPASSPNSRSSTCRASAPTRRATAPARRR